eukprot:1373930-Prymnesium_polylepis.1
MPWRTSVNGATVELNTKTRTGSSTLHTLGTLLSDIASRADNGRHTNAMQPTTKAQDLTRPCCSFKLYEMYACSHVGVRPTKRHAGRHGAPSGQAG